MLEVYTSVLDSLHDEGKVFYETNGGTPSYCAEMFVVVVPRCEYNLDNAFSFLFGDN